MRHHNSTKFRSHDLEHGRGYSSRVIARFGRMLFCLSTALTRERDLSADACFDPAFQHWQAEADSAWSEARVRADAVIVCGSVEPEDHLLQRMAWLIRLVLDVDRPDHLRDARDLVARHVRLARALPLSPETTGLLCEAGALVDEIVLQASEPGPGGAEHDETGMYDDISDGIPAFA